MNRKQFVILLVFVVILGAAGLVLRNRENASWEAPNTALGQKLLGKFPVNDVAAISLKQGTNELDLVKKDDVWRVRERDDYPANYSDIRDFLLKAQDLKVIQSEKVGRSQLPRLALVPGTGTNAAMVVDFKDEKGKPIKSLLLGKKHMRESTGASSPYGGMGEGGWPDGRYVKLAGDSGTVALVSETLANIEPKPAQWLDKDFFKIEKIHSIAVDYPNPTNSWKLTRDAETTEWKLADAKPDEKLDITKATSVASPLASPYFNDVVSKDAKPKDLGLDKPTVVKVETFDNFSYTLKVGTKTNDTYPLAMTVSADIPKERTVGKDEKKEDKEKLDKEFQDKQKKLQDKLAQESKLQNWTYLVSSWSLDSLLKNRADLLEKKKEEKEKDKTASADKPSISTSTTAPPAPLKPAKLATTLPSEIDPAEILPPPGAKPETHSTDQKK